MDAGNDEKAGKCWECGYSLRGQETPRCPECGRGFDPADVTTMNMGIVVGPIKKWLMRPPGWPIHVLTVAAVVLSLWACAWPMRRGELTDSLSNLVVYHDRPWAWERVENDILQFWSAYGQFYVAVLMWLLIGALWTIRRIARGITVKRLSKQKAATFAYWRRWLITPIVFGLTILVGRSNFPVWAGFWLSKPWLDQAVQDARADSSNRHHYDYVHLPPRWLGIYPPAPDRSSIYSTHLGKSVLAAELSPGETVLFLTHHAGRFIYRDDQQPPSFQRDNEFGSGKPSIRHLSGPWYIMEYGRSGGD